MHVGPLRTSVKTELYDQSHWVGAGQTEILSPNTTQTPQDHCSDYVRRFTKSWGSMHSHTHTAFCVWDALELFGTIKEHSQSHSWRFQAGIPRAPTASREQNFMTFEQVEKTWKSWATEEERRRSKGRRSRCGIISWTWIGYSKQMIISKKSQPELFLVEQIIFKKSEPFLIEASWHPSSFIPFSDFSHDAMCSFRHRVTHGETGWRSPAPFAGGRPSCHHSGCPSAPQFKVILKWIEWQR